MNILVLEDRGSVALPLKDLLDGMGHTVELVPTITQATERLSDDGTAVDCLIVDLNMPPHGLSTEEIEKTEGGLLAGLVWLETSAFSLCPELRSRTVIYTAYTNELREHADDRRLRGLRILAKEHGSDALVEHIREISVNLRGRAI